MLDIKFHCDEKQNFPGDFLARAFSYKEYSVEMHNHDFYEVNIVLAGSGTHCIEKGKVRVRSGDVFIIPPMVAHAYIDTEGLEIYHILLKKSFLAKNRGEAENVSGYLQLTEIEPYLRSNVSRSCFLHLNQRQLLQIRAELEFIDDRGEYPWEDCAWMKYHTIWKILYWFSRLLTLQNRTLSDSSESRYEIQIINALEYIHNHYQERITIDDLSKEVFLSRSTFLRSFRDVCGVPPMEYLNAYRYKKAGELLDTAQLSKTTVAHNCGFYDLSHMERMLKKYGRRDDKK